MRRLSTVLAMLTAAAVILGCAALPWAAGRWIDARGKAPGYRELSPISLTIRESISPATKLALFSKLDGIIAVSNDSGEMTPLQAQEAAQAALRPYFDAGFIPYEEQYATVEAQLVFGLTEDTYADTDMAFWFVYLVREDCSIQLAIDDETGALMSISFEWNSEYSLKTQEKIISEWPTIFMSELGISSTEVESIGTTGSSEYRFAQYLIHDATMGDLVLGFYVHLCGFHMDFAL